MNEVHVPDVAETASAQPAETTTTDTQTAQPVSAVDAAVASDDMGAFKRARLAERSGKPLPSATAKPATAAAADGTATTKPDGAAASTERPPISNRQARANDAVRVAVDRATADLRAENERLRAQLPKPDSAASRSGAAATGTRASTAPATLQDVLQRPDVSKPILPEADFFAQFPDANFGDYTRYAARYEFAAAQAERDRETTQATRQRERTERSTKFQDRIRAVAAADATFIGKLDVDLLERLVPFDALPEDAEGGPLNALAQELFEEPEHIAVLLPHLSAHPEEVDRLAQLSPRRLIREIGRLEGRLGRSASGAGAPPPKTVTSAPPPPPALGRQPAEPADPETAAVIADDMTAFKAARLQKRLAAKGA